MPQREIDPVNRSENPFQTASARTQERFDGLSNDWIHVMLDSTFIEGRDDHFVHLRPFM